MHRAGSFKRWMYRGDRPHALAKFFNRIYALVAQTGIAPNYLITLEVVGRKSGKTIAFPLVVAVADHQRYLVSMLGNNAQWVLNMRANNNKAVIRGRKRTPVMLEDVPIEKRAPLLKAYLQRAPGARPHIPVDKDAPVSAFEKIAADYPVFRIVPMA